MDINVSGKEDENLWEIILDLDLFIKAGRGTYQLSASQTFPQNIPNEQGELMDIPGNLKS